MRFGHTNTIDSAARDLRRDLRAVAQDTEALIEATAGETGRRVSLARARAERSLRRVRTDLDVNRWQEPARRALRAGDEYVHHNPWRIIGAAAGAGLILGWLLSLVASLERNAR